VACEDSAGLLEGVGGARRAWRVFAGRGRKLQMGGALAPRSITLLADSDTGPDKRPVSLFLLVV